MKRFLYAMSVYTVLGLLSLLTLTGPIRLATLVLLAGLAVKTCIVLLQRRQEGRQEGVSGPDE